MKKYVSILLAVLMAVSVLTGCAGQTGAPGQRMASNTNASVSIPDASAGKEDYQMLSAFQFNDYQHMTVSKFQNRVWRTIDTAEEYRELLERLSQDEALYQMKENDETAWFLFYILEPLTAENWQARSYSGVAESDLPAPAQNARLEYTFTLHILNADALMVKDYNDIRWSIMDSIQYILKNRPEEDLRDETVMLTEIQNYLDDILRDMQTPELYVDIEYAYFPLPAEKETQTNAYPSGSTEQRRYPNGTEEDYRSLLALKTPEYQSMPLTDFNRALSAWCSEDYERMDRIDEDTQWEDFPLFLTDEECSFVKHTVHFSGMENGKMLQSLYTGTPPIDPCLDVYLPQKTVRESSMAAWCGLSYRFSYHIADPQMLTVGERDSALKSMMDAVQAFWDNTEVEYVLKMRESDVTAELEKFAAAHSTGQITIAIETDRIHWEHMDERACAG